MQSQNLYAYLAGLTDGEGTISIFRRGKYALKPHFEIQVSSGDALYKLKDKLAKEGIDLHVYAHLPDKRKENYKTMYSAQVLSLANLEIVLERTLPFYLIKKEQAQILLNLVRKRRKVLANDYHAHYDAGDSENCRKIQGLNGNKNNARRGISNF